MNGAIIIEGCVPTGELYAGNVLGCALCKT